MEYTKNIKDEYKLISFVGNEFSKFEYEDKNKNPENKKVHIRTTINDKIMQIGFKSNKGLKVKIVNSKGEEISEYQNLEELSATKEEIKVIDKIKSKIKYDGDQLLIKGALYNKNTNELFLEARRTKYSFLRSLLLGKIKRENENFYKTGVLVYHKDKEGKTIFIERKKDGFFSVAGGFIECKKFSDDIVLDTAINESKEELGVNIKKQDTGIRGFSIRKSKTGKVGTIEFIVEHKIDKIEMIINKVKNNNAKDKDEHTDRYFIAPTNNEDIKELKKTIRGGAIFSKITETENKENPIKLELLEGPRSGTFLYGAILNVDTETNLLSETLGKQSKTFALDNMSHVNQEKNMPHVNQEKKGKDKKRNVKI
jgi:hypothetical protein